MNHFLRVKSADDENISLAIETVGEAKDEKLSRTLLDFLLGQHDDGQVEIYLKCVSYVLLVEKCEVSVPILCVTRSVSRGGFYSYHYCS